MADQVAVTSKDIQAEYIKLYKFLMQYLWEYSTVEALANLELECYKAFPDKEAMFKYVNDLEHKINSTYNELTEDDLPEFEEAFNKFKQLIEDYDPENAEVELYAVSQPAELPISEDKEDNIYKFGNIEKIESEEEESAEEVEEPKEDERISNPFEEEEYNENPEE